MKRFLILSWRIFLWALVYVLAMFESAITSARLSWKYTKQTYTFANRQMVSTLKKIIHGGTDEKM